MLELFSALRSLVPKFALQRCAVHHGVSTTTTGKWKTTAASTAAVKKGMSSNSCCHVSLHVCLAIRCSATSRCRTTSDWRSNFTLLSVLRHLSSLPNSSMPRPS
ncbi:hypothetical protein TRVL_09452 [Trypanosoma vivax]|nr:hypothetical protein TRVL_09452 [Trypanosoma vivax]